MLNPYLKSERVRAQVWSIRKDSGRCQMPPSKACARSRFLYGPGTLPGPRKVCHRWLLLSSIVPIATNTIAATSVPAVNVTASEAAGCVSSTP